MVVAIQERDGKLLLRKQMNKKKAERTDRTGRRAGGWAHREEENKRANP